MRRRFVIGVDPLNVGQELRFREYIKKQGGSWWHWVGNFWLITTKDNDLSAEQIRDKILEINPTARVVVFEFPEDITWAASASTNARGAMITDWLKDPWGKE
jgi:hypothetical protein